MLNPFRRKKPPAGETWNENTESWQSSSSQSDSGSAGSHFTSTTEPLLPSDPADSISQPLAQSFPSLSPSQSQIISVNPSYGGFPAPLNLVDANDARHFPPVANNLDGMTVGSSPPPPSYGGFPEPAGSPQPTYAGFPDPPAPTVTSANPIDDNDRRHFGGDTAPSYAGFPVPPSSYAGFPPPSPVATETGKGGPINGFDTNVPDGMVGTPDGLLPKGGPGITLPGQNADEAPELGFTPPGTSESIGTRGRMVM